MGIGMFLQIIQAVTVVILVFMVSANILGMLATSRIPRMKRLKFFRKRQKGINHGD